MLKRTIPLCKENFQAKLYFNYKKVYSAILRQTLIVKSLSLRFTPVSPIFIEDYFNGVIKEHFYLLKEISNRLIHNHTSLKPFENKLATNELELTFAKYECLHTILQDCDNRLQEQFIRIVNILDEDGILKLYNETKSFSVPIKFFADGPPLESSLVDKSRHLILKFNFNYSQTIYLVKTPTNNLKVLYVFSIPELFKTETHCPQYSLSFNCVLNFAELKRNCLLVLNQETALDK